jgi:hypothetical protein
MSFISLNKLCFLCCKLYTVCMKPVTLDDYIDCVKKYMWTYGKLYAGWLGI